MMTIRQRIEENIAIWLLATLLTGFLSGIATIKAIHELAGLEIVSKMDRQGKEAKVLELTSTLEGLRKKIADDAKASASLQACPAPIRSACETPRATVNPKSGPKPLALADTTQPAIKALAPFLNVRVGITFYEDYRAKAEELRGKLREGGAIVSTFDMWPSNLNRGVPQIRYASGGVSPAALTAATFLESEVTRLMGQKTFAREHSHTRWIDLDVAVYLTRE